MNLKLAEIAKEEAMKFYHGNIMGSDSNLYIISEDFCNNDFTVDMLENCWCTVFVYYCIKRAGYKLCIKPSGVKRSLGEVGIWEQWSKLKEVNLWESDIKKPEIGDIVLFNNVFDGNNPDHIGIVVNFSSDFIETAEGNFNNVSAIVRRSYSCIRGYVRFSEIREFNSHRQKC